MTTDRRAFLALSSLGTGSLFASIPARRRPRAGLRLRFRPYTLELRHVFTIAGSSRKTTPVMLTEVEFDGQVGYGECSMPPYLGE